MSDLVILWTTGLLRPWDFPGKSTGVGGHCLLQHHNSKASVLQRSAFFIVQLSQFVVIYTVKVEKAMAPHSSTLAWKIPWTEEPGGL